jgi:hypothetical protein
VRPPLVSGYRQHRFLALFVVLLFTMAGHASIEALAPGANVLEWLLALSLCSRSPG